MNIDNIRAEFPELQDAVLGSWVQLPNVLSSLNMA